MISKKFLFLPIFSFFLLSSCYQTSKKCCGHKSHQLKKRQSCCPKQSTSARVHVTDLSGKNIKGEVFFEQAAGKGEVEISAKFTGLTPNRKFGFHVHEFGDCSNKALMAGGHFNPFNKKHGSPEDDEKHLGDLGNLHSDEKGQVSYSAIVEGKVKKFLGRSAIVHALPDDLESQPTGNSGTRIACGLIVASMPSVVPKVSDSKKEVQKNATTSSQPPANKTDASKNIKGYQKASEKLDVKSDPKPKATEKLTAKPDPKPKATEKPAAKPPKPKATEKPDAKPDPKPKGDSS